jgi:hypothetical protein
MSRRASLETSPFIRHGIPQMSWYTNISKKKAEESIGGGGGVHPRCGRPL